MSVAPTPGAASREERWRRITGRAETDESILRRYFDASRRPPVPSLPRGLPAGLDVEQRRAIGLITSGFPGVVLLTGAAGSGKTHVLAESARLLTTQHRRLVILAVAHRALYNVRRRLAPAGVTGVEYATMARATLDPRTVRDAHVVVVDEASMVSAHALRILIEYLPYGAMLVLTGDPHQLPPVAPGEPFVMALKRGVPRVHLQRNYRQAGAAGLVRFAGLLRAGAELPACLGPEVALHADVKRPTEALAGLLQRSTGSAEAPVIVTWRRSDGIRANLVAQAVRNQGAERLFDVEMRGSGEEERSVPVRVGDRVAVTRNLLDHELCNGMMARLVDASEDEVVLEADGRRVPLPRSLAPSALELGYALTVHRAQGGEWPHVIVYQPGPVGTAPERWFYTAATRARERLDIVTRMSRGAFWRHHVPARPAEGARGTVAA